MQITELFSGWLDFIFFFCILNACLAWLEISFFSKFTSCTATWCHHAGYVLIIYSLAVTEMHFQFSFPMATAFELAALFLFGWLVLKCQPALSAITTVLAICIMQVSNGIFQSLLSIVFTTLFSYTSILMAASGLSVMVVVFFSYRLVLTWLNGRRIFLLQYVLVLLLPIFFVLLVMQHVFAAYGNMVVINPEGTRIFPNVNDWTMLGIQIAAYFCLFAVLFAYKKLSEGFELQMRNALLEQQVHTQAISIQEMQLRYEQTRAFRHDLKGHWTVLGGFLKEGESQNALEYLGKLTSFSDQLSFPCQTGNIALDMLLTNKLGLARQKGIDVNCTVKIPGGNLLDALDLCIVFSNAVDNAINACSSVVQSNRYLTLSAVQKSGFFLIEIENSRTDKMMPTKGSGIGLESIKAVVKKYQGTVRIEKNLQMFRLNILFVIPRQPDDI
ncbi:GHKL domain-containing protein [Aminipila butyrica]|uniref:GHKL domain-containing protein n=1 Tax=Aminipila butyrica TaxID=433296 RepID=A0A858BWM4_9FIRM|nr:sensor histidine kinase [Aminipila butyrica]QIB70333.1 GHKL domain-containing protein [Aminipila butyrica]